MKSKYCPDLAHDGAECDANYIKLCQLLPAMDEIDSVEFGIPLSKPELARIRFEILERCRYTTFVALHFDNMSNLIGGEWLEQQDLHIRLYHDLKTAEVTAYASHKRMQARYEYPNQSMLHPDEKSQMNSFLGELLSHCLENGHTLDWLFEKGRVLQSTP